MDSDSATITLLRHQLETTLLLLAAMSPRMSNNDITMARIRLSEAGSALGRVLADRSAAITNGKLELAL